jgi:hypothetical protein
MFWFCLLSHDTKSKYPLPQLPGWCHENPDDFLFRENLYYILQEGDHTSGAGQSGFQTRLGWTLDKHRNIQA